MAAKIKFTPAKCKYPRLPSLSLPGSSKVHEHSGSRGREGRTEPALSMLNCVALTSEGQERQEQRKNILFIRIIAGKKVRRLRIPVIKMYT